MGIIKAAHGSLSGVLADEWLEIYSCDSLPQGILAMRAEKKTGQRSANTKGEENVISDGSVIIVNPGQCALAIDKGQITGCYDTPGKNIYHSDRSPSIFHKGGLKGIIRQSCDRFGYGGVAGVYQVIVFLDIREHMGNPFALKVPIHLKDRNTGLSLDATLELGGMFSFRIIRPDVFYKKICGASTGTVKVSDILPQISADFNTVLMTAIGKRFKPGVTAYDIGTGADVIADEAASLISESWIEERGFAISSVAVDRIFITQEDKDLLQSVQLAKALTDPTLAAAALVGAQAQAMQSAANNTGEKSKIHAVFRYDK